MVSADRARARSQGARKAGGAAPAERGGKKKMIDVQLLRNDADAVARRLAGRAGYALDVGRFRQIEGRRKDIQTQVEKTQAERNQLAKQIGQAKSKGEDAGELMKKAEALKSSLGA